MEDDKSAGRIDAEFATRQGAELAIEHLVQEHGIDRSVIFVEAVGEESSVGTAVGGSDTAGTPPSHGERHDAPLKGSIRLTVPVADDTRAQVVGALRQVGARRIGA